MATEAPLAYYGTIADNQEPSRLVQSKRRFSLKRIVTTATLLLGVAGVVVLFHSSRSFSPLSSSTAGLERSSVYQRSTFDRSIPLVSQCEEKYFTQTLDHFNVRKENQSTYEQRYFICSKYWKRSENGPIFFYLGNEASVDLYLNNTGLMWENAEEFGALLVFAEHRYFGKSLPFGDKTSERMEFLSSEQALADYASLIFSLKETLDAKSSGVIGFGGSYGGMLAAWFRMKYPHMVNGVISGSAPILSFAGEKPPVDSGKYNAIIADDASEKGGAAPYCSKHVRSSWKYIFGWSKSDEGKQRIADAFRLCHLPSTGLQVAGWITSAYDYMAMGNYPFPSSYIMNGKSTLPAFPIRVACSEFSPNYNLEEESGVFELLEDLRKSVSLYHNSTQDQECFSLDAGQPFGDYWDYLYCSELSQQISSDGVRDMYWPNPYNKTQERLNCESEWNVTPKFDWPTINYGGREALKAASNIFFSNGEYDPWAGLGVTPDVAVGPSVKSVIIKEAGHHLDLMFSNPEDTDDVKAVREMEKQEMRKWLSE